jgi:hypothetical protein
MLLKRCLLCLSVASFFYPFLQGGAKEKSAAVSEAARKEGGGDTFSETNHVVAPGHMAEASRSSGQGVYPTMSEEHGQGSYINDRNARCPLSLIATAVEVEEHGDGAVESPSYAAMAAAATTLTGPQVSHTPSPFSRVDSLDIPIN